MAACKLAAQLEAGHALALPADRVMALLLLAAEAGEADAQTQLGRLHFDGRHTQNNVTEALRWFSRAAERGDPFAQAWLGDALSTGQGAIRDEAAAMSWYRKAAAGGYLPALSIITSATLTPSATPEAQQEIFQLWIRAAEAGDALAQRMVGDFALRGIGTSASATEAVNWLRKSADQGDRTAKLMLAGIYLQDQAEPDDANEPIDLPAPGALEQGDADAAIQSGGLPPRRACVQNRTWPRPNAGTAQAGRQAPRLRPTGSGGPSAGDPSSDEADRPLKLPVGTPKRRGEARK